MCLNFESGGGGGYMINLRHFIEAKRIRFIHKIVNSKPGTYWLSLTLGMDQG